MVSLFECNETLPLRFKIRVASESTVQCMHEFDSSDLLNRFIIITFL